MKDLLQNSTMQSDDKSKLEERVIAYFDGSLDSEGSRSLLREVAESPEKRALFKAHETLSRLIVAARTPMEAPLEVKRSIAERIPGMLAFIPGLLGTAETAPIVSQNANPFIAFFARMSLTTAVSIGSAVALLTAGILLKNNFESNSMPVSSKMAAVQNPAMRNFASSPTTPSSRIYASHGTHSHIRTLAAQPIVSFTNSNNNEQSNSDIANVAQPISTMPASLAAADIPTQSTESLLPIPLAADEGITVRPYVSSGERYVTLNGIDGPNTVQTVPSYLVGLDFEMGDRYAFRVQGGSSSFAELKNVRTSDMIASYPVDQSKVSAQSAAWATVGFSYSFPVIGSVPLILSADGGAVFLSNRGLLGMLGASTEIPISHQILFRPSVTYDAVWTSLSGVASSGGNSSSGDVIYRNPVSSSSITSTAIGFNLSLVFRP